MEQEGDGEGRLLRCDHKVILKHESEPNFSRLGKQIPHRIRETLANCKFQFSFALTFTLNSQIEKGDKLDEL